MNFQTDQSRFRSSVIKIDRTALKENFYAISQMVSPSKVAVCVKANAYGHGIVEVSRTLADVGVYMLCVATAEEALLLRDSSIAVPILLLSEPPMRAVEQLLENDITLTVYTFEMIEAIAKYSTPNKKAKVHLKVDTGMNRVGVSTQEALKFASYISTQETLLFEGLFTHFATADQPDHPGTKIQLERFEQVLDEFEMAKLTPELIHAANSSAAINIPSSRFSMVRVGISAYGLYPEPKCAQTITLKPVLSLLSTISYLKTIQAGDSVSYGWTWTAENETQIATLPIGYGDGVPRNIGTLGGCVLIAGKKCPIVGRATMDQLMVDVTDLPVKIGDEVTLIGSQADVSITATDWADLIGTISYEVLTSFGERLDRVYD